MQNLAYTKSQPFISYSDIEKLVYDISYLWNLMTDTTAIASTEYISQIYNLFDTDGDGIIDFNEYNIYWKKINFNFSIIIKDFK